MSNKEADLDILAEAFLPADLLTPTLGSNYGMDGFPDMQYGMGVLKGVLDQEYQEAPAFPTGVQKAGASDMDLGFLLAGESLADLNWLDPDQPQDPDRLPRNPVDLSIPELVEAWGVHRRTDGVHQMDLAHARSTEEAPKKKANARIIEKVVTHAMRRSIEGQHIERIVREAAESMGSEMERVVPLLRRVATDHGLAGNVFIRASAYPGWGAGKGKAHAKKHAKKARYLVVSKQDMDQAVWIQNGRCAYTGKLAVTEVPWKKAHAHYAPRLEATGHKVAGSSDPREALRVAFLSQPRKVEADTGYLPTHETPDQRVSHEDAKKAFASHRPERAVYDHTDRDHARRLAKVKTRLAQMERDNLIPLGEADRILSSDADPMGMLRKATQVARHVSQHTYESNAVTHGQALLSAQRTERSHLAQDGRSQRLHRAASDKAIAVVRGFLDRGVATEQRVRQLFATHKDIQKVAASLSREASQVLAPKRDYKGMVFKAASLNSTDQVNLSDENKAIAKAAADNGVAANEIKGVLKTARRVMSEGFAGSDLTSYLTNRFSNSLLTASKGMVDKVRTAHEGLSGFVYVDAEAYASPAGVKGCESGSVKHRANQIQNVREIPRCGSCSVARVREDGTRKCGIYNKTLVTAVDVSGPELLQIKQANIKSTEMNDAEVTASLFAPTFDPSEFGLVNASLEDVAFDSLPETEKLAKIMFDGWRIE